MGRNDVPIATLASAYAGRARRNRNETVRRSHRHGKRAGESQVCTTGKSDKKAAEQIGII